MITLKGVCHCRNGTLYIFVVLFLGACFSNRLPKEEIEYLTIIANPIAGSQPTIIVTEKPLQDEIVESIVSSRREPAKFRAEYKIEIKYKTNTKYVLVNEKYLNIDGLTYVANENLGARLAALFLREKH